LCAALSIRAAQVWIGIDRGTPFHNGITTLWTLPHAPPWPLEVPVISRKRRGIRP
jgi:hypothetical protein